MRFQTVVRFQALANSNVRLVIAIVIFGTKVSVEIPQSNATVDALELKFVNQRTWPVGPPRHF